MSLSIMFIFQSPRKRFFKPLLEYLDFSVSELSAHDYFILHLNYFV